MLVLNAFSYPASMEDHATAWEQVYSNVNATQDS